MKAELGRGQLGLMRGQEKRTENDNERHEINQRQDKSDKINQRQDKSDYINQRQD